MDQQPYGRGHTSGKCIETSVLVEGRDSGGPLIVNGFLVGIASFSCTFDDGLPNSIFSSIENTLNCEIDGERLADKVKESSGSVMCKPIMDNTSAT